MTRTALLAVLGLGLALSTACLKRSIVEATDHPSGDMTILETTDIWLPINWGHYVYWECTPQGDGLTCKKSCNVKNAQGQKIKCQQIFVVPQ